MSKDRKEYNEFYNEFQFFIKEGICQEPVVKDQLGKLLMFESNNQPAGEVLSLDEYVGNSTPEQKDIYYLVAPNRQAALQSPYLETFKKNNIEVLFLYHTIDDFVMGNLQNYNKRSLISIESGNINLPGEQDKTDETDKELDETEEESDESKLSKSDQDTLCAWFKDTLGSDRVKDVKITNRLHDSPCIVTDHESASLRRMMRMVVSTAIM